MFVRAAAAREAPSGKIANALRARPSHDSVAEHEPDTAVAPARFSWSLRNLLPSTPADDGQSNSSDGGRSAATRRPSLPLQAKLEIGAVDDPLEHEADLAADRVTRMIVPAPLSGLRQISSASPKSHAASLQRKCACGGTCDKCSAEQADEEHGKVQRKVGPATSSPISKPAPAIVHQVLSEPGAPLDSTTRAFFEPRFGWDFSRVRVHSGARASESARAVNARAYTVRNHIVFRNDEIDPSGSQGRTLVAHELAHVIQQQSPQSNVLRRQPANQPDEPLDVALARQDLLEKIGEFSDKIREGMDAARVDSAEHEAKIAPFFVQEDPQVKSFEQQITSGRTQLPAQLATLHNSLKVVGREVLKEGDDLDQLHARITLITLANSFLPSLLQDTAEYAALLKKQETGEQDYARKLASFEGIRKEIELTKRLLPERAAHLRQRSQYLETQARSAAKTANVGPDTDLNIGQLTLLRTIIEASPTLRPYLAKERAGTRPPTDLRNVQTFKIESSDSDLQREAQACHQGEAEPGTKIGGFYCRQTDTIHLPPDAKFGTALHESIHKYSQVVLRGACSPFLNEGLTQHFADIVLADQGLPKFTGHAYQKQLECAARFIARFHLDEVASFYFLGTQGLGSGPLDQYIRDRNRPCTTFCAREQGSSGH